MELEWFTWMSVNQSRYNKFDRPTDKFRFLIGINLDFLLMKRLHVLEVVIVYQLLASKYTLPFALPILDYSSPM